MRILAFRYRIGKVVPVAIAEEVQKTIERIYGYRSAPLIPNGILTDEYTLSPEIRLRWRRENRFNPDDILCVCVARFSRQKNHTVLLNAFAKITHPKVHLLLVGMGELENDLRQQVSALDLQQRVHFLGIRADIPPILNASDIFVLASLWEGNPMSVQEAMASGLPVIGTRVGGVPELVEDGISGLIVPPNDEHALVRALQTLINQPDLRKQMGERALQRARTHFDIRNTVRAYETLYEQIREGRFHFR